MSWRASGFRAWLLQRLSAVYLAVYFVYFLLVLLIAPPVDYAQWQGWIMSPLMALATSIFFLALLMHAWVGMRDVLIDYVHPFALRFVLLTGLALALLTMGLWVLKVLLMGTR